MVTPRSLHFLLVCILSVGIALAGCAKRPATTQAAAPAPTGTGAATAAPSTTMTTPAPAPTTMQPSGPTTPGGGTATRPPDPRPDVKTFTSIPELKDVFFDFDKYDIRPEDSKTLDANAGWFKSNPNHLILIEGHCDERGTNEYNLALGERRAKATMNYLVSQGVQASRITIISYGEERPSCSEKTEGCWAKNRRAHYLEKPR